MRPQKTVACAFLVLTGCSGEASVPTVPLDFTDCGVDDIRFVVLRGVGLCGAQSPEAAERGPDEQVLADEIWKDWRTTEPPRLRVPARGGRTVIAYCLNRSWGGMPVDSPGLVFAAACDDDADGAITLRFEQVCRSYDGEDGDIACPWGPLWASYRWQGAAGQVCVEACPSCEDLDRDGYISTACGGDDCDDSILWVNPGAPDPPSDCFDRNCDGDQAREHDADRDGYCASCWQTASAQPEGCEDVADCDDADDSTYPGAEDRVDQWQVTRLVSGDAPGLGYARPPRVAMDSGGHAHVCYDIGLNDGGGGVYYTNDVAGWAEPVRIGALAGGEEACAIGVDQDDSVHIAYVGDTGGGIRLLYATNESGSWAPDQLVATASVVDAARWFSMAVESGLVHLAFQGPEGTLLYAAGGADGFELETVDQDPTAGVSPSIAVDHGIVHIAYLKGPRGSTLYYARGPGAWELGTISASSEVEDGTLAVDSTGRLYAAYVIGDEPGVQLAAGGLHGWSVQTIDAEGGEFFMDPSVFVDAHDGLHIAYARSRLGRLRYARTRGVCPWRFEDVKGSSLSARPDLEVGSGTAFIGFLSQILSSDANNIEIARRGDDIDQNCDLLDGTDADGDGFVSEETGGDDCNDDTADVNPARIPDPWNSEVDNNCDCIY